MMRLFVYISFFTGVFGVILQPSPAANIQRFNILVLNCSVEKSSTTVAFHLETLNIAFFFNKRSEACRNYAEPTPGLYETSCDYNSSTFYLTINNVTDTYDGKRIECMNKEGRARTTINVQYPPTASPSLTQIPSGPVIEGNKITLMCNITGGNPLASIVWQCIGFTYVTQISNNYTEVSVVERIVTKEDNGKECICIIQHPLLETDKEVRSTLNVYYSPSKPSIIQTPSGPVNPGNFITITCEIQGGNPLAVISWQCKDSTPIAPTENPITNISVSSVRLKVKIDDSGDVCMCVGSHLAWTKQKIYNITLSVRKPVTKVILTPSSLNNVNSVEDGENKTFTCTTDLSDLTAFIQWYFDGQNITNQAIPQPPLMRSGKFISSSKLIYTGKEEDINKTIYCEAVSIEGEYSVQSIVQSICILFGPKSISVSPAGYLYVVSEDHGINMSIICAAICSPDCNYTWTGPNGFREHHFSLKLNSVYRNQTGLYMCQAENDYGSKTSNSITIVVNYAPTILRLQALNSNTVDEHQSVTFQCEVDSYPAPDITWVHSITGTLLNKVEKVFKSNFTILKTECLQTGTYRCQTSNVIGDMLKTVYAEIDLFVLCSARMDQRRMEEPGLFAIMENDDWNITVYLIAYPEPMISWTRRNSETAIMSIMNVYNSFTSNISEHSSTLSIRKISKSDYGVYTMNASNNIGLQYIKSFEVIPLDPPDQPTNMSVVCEVTSVIVSWRSGFNGGSQQKFRVAWLNIRTQNTKYSPDIMDPGQGYIIQYINSLEPSTSYNIYVEATNKQGVVKSGNAYCTTGSSLSQSNNTIAISVGASVGSSMLILIIAVLLVLFLRRRPCKKEENLQLYQSTYPDTSRQKTNIDQHTYDELQTIKKGSNPEYEHVNSVSTYEEIGIANPGSHYQNANKDNEESKQRPESSTVYANTQTSTVYVNTQT